MGSVALILAVSAAAVVLYVFLVEPLWVLPVLEWLTPNIVYRVKTGKALVALSFDDGPHPEFTPQVLEILEVYEVKATFFLIGERAERHPELVRQIREAGHEIGNHYWQNGTTLGHSESTFAENLRRTEWTIRATTDDTAGDVGRAASSTDSAPTTSQEQGPEPKNNPMTIAERLRFFRPPGGVAWPWQLRLARKRGYTSVLGCAYPHDPMRPPVKYMRWLMEKNLRAGTIVILHDGIRNAGKSIEVLPQILEAGKRRGLQFVAIGELVGARNPGT